MKRLTSSTLLITLVWGILPISAIYAATPVVNTTISVFKTGSEPFDLGVTWDGNDLATAGFDEDEENNVTRLQDSITYKVEVSINDNDVNELTSTVQLDSKQAWIEIPSGCQTDPAIVANISTISIDKTTLFCNLGPAIEGTNRIFFPAARAIGASADGSEITLNDDRVSASVSSQGDGSIAASDTSEDTIVTANFRVNTTKDLKVPDVDTDGDGNVDVVYDPPLKDGPSGEQGVLMEYVIKATYEKGSMVADSDEITFEVDYDLLDFYTDNNDNNNTSGSGGDLSTGGILYTWGLDPGCSLIGDHGANATVSCTQDSVSGDFTGPSFVPDGVNDPNITIDLDNIDVRDPDNDSNLIEVAINLWFPRTPDIDGHQSCPSCENYVINSVGTYSSGSILGFNPISTEDVGENNLLNYNGSGEPSFTDQTRSFVMTYSSPGTYSAYMSHFKMPWGTSHKLQQEQYVSAGETVAIMNNVFDYRTIDGARSQTCTKLDLTKYEYIGLSPAPRADLGYGWNHGPTNPNGVAYFPGVSTAFFDTSPFSKYLYSNDSHATLTELKEDFCDDDVNGDSSVVIMNMSGSLVDENGNPTTGTVDWWEDPDMVTGSRSAISKVRWESYYDKPAALAASPAHTHYGITTNYNVKVQDGLTSGYGSNNYLASYMTYRFDTGPGSEFSTWRNTLDTSVVDDPEAVNFSLSSSFADRNILVPSNHSVAKETSPKGIKVIRGGDIIDFIITPQVLGLWNNTINTATVNDNLPNGTDYVAGSEEFSIDGGSTWLNRTDYDASSPDITITSSQHQGFDDPLIWNFGSVDAGEQLPLIKYSVQADPSRTSGSFTNTAVITGDIGADQDGDGFSDSASATYQLTILPEYGFDVFKTVSNNVQSTNTPFTYDLVYKNLGGEDYSEGEFIDILPYHDDGNGGITSGLNSTRDPSTTFNGSLTLTNISSSNGEIFYATDVNPTSISQDPCSADNLPNGYTPASGDLCYQVYMDNGGTLPGGGTQGTGTTNWQTCSSLTTPVTCGTIVPEDITAVKFVTGNIAANAGGQIVSLELTPFGNIGGTPDIDSEGKVTDLSTGDVYTNTFGGRIKEISLNVISNDVSVTVVSGSIGDTIWYDLNGDGIEDSGEPGIEGVVVNLLDGSGNPIYVDPVTGAIVDSSFPGAVPYTATTDVNGEYSFENLPQGDYQISIDPSTLPAGAEQTHDSDGLGSSNISDTTLDLEADAVGNIIGVEDDEDQDFGYNYTPLGSIGNYIWNDENADGIQDSSEGAFSGVTLNLLDGAGDPIYVDPLTGMVVSASDTGAVPYTVQTDANGEYLFDNLPVGLYQVQVDPSTLPVDTFQSYDADGLGTPHTSTHTLIEIENDDGVVIDLVDNNDQDFGYFTGVPSWTLEKATTSTPMKAGDTLDYTFILTNTGDLPISFVNLSDEKCTSGPTLDTNTDANSDNILSPLEQWEYSCTSIPVTQVEADDGEVVNIATATGTPLGGILDDAVDEVTKPVGPIPDIELIKSISSVVDTTEDGVIGVGDTVNYHFEITNTGNVTLSDVTVMDTSLPGLVLVGGPVPTMAPNNVNTTNYTASYILTQADVDAGGIENTAIVTGTDPNDMIVGDTSDTGTTPDGTTIVNPDGTQTDNPLDTHPNNGSDPTEDPTSYLISPNPDIRLIKSISSVVDTTEDGIIGAGDTVSYNFEITNTGNVTLSDVTLTDTSLPGMVLVGSPVLVIGPDHTNSVNYSATYVLTQDDVNFGGIENTASVSGTDPNGTVVEDISDTGTAPDTSSVSNPDTTETDNPLAVYANNTGDTTEDPTSYLIEKIPQIELYKSGVFNDENNDGKAEFGETISYTFKVVNTGNIDLTNIVVTDPLITVNGGPIATLAVGATDTLTFTGSYSLFQPDVIAGFVENTATVIAQSVAGPTSDVSDTATDRSGSPISNPGEIETPNGDNTTDSDASNDYTVVEYVAAPTISGSSSGGSGGGHSSRSNPTITPLESSTLPAPIITPLGTSTPLLNSAPSAPINSTNSVNVQELKEKYDTEITKKVAEYEDILEALIEEQIQEETIKGESLLKALPKELPRTGTPISDRIETKPNSRVATELPSADTFRLAGSTNNDVNHWKQVLVEEDRNAQKYIVVPSNGLVVPINEFGSDSKDFDTMINGREGNINPALRTGALEYPGTSTRGYGEVGNKVVFAHSSYWKDSEGRYKTHFQKIIELDVGEEVWVYEKNASGGYSQYKYVTEASYNTPASDTSVLTPGEGKNLTLFTCTPIGGVEGRWIIKAKYIENAQSPVEPDQKNILDIDTQYKRQVQSFITKLRAIPDDTERLDSLYTIYARIDEKLTEHQDNEELTSILQLLQYRIAQEIMKK